MRRVGMGSRLSGLGLVVMGWVLREDPHRYKVEEDAHLQYVWRTIICEKVVLFIYLFYFFGLRKDKLVGMAFVHGCNEGKSITFLLLCTRMYL